MTRVRARLHIVDVCLDLLLDVEIVSCNARPAQKQQREQAGFRAKPVVSKETLALLADLTLKQTEGTVCSCHTKTF